MTLDELIDTGQKLSECGESLIRTANEIKAAFTETEPVPSAKAETQAQTKTPEEKTYTKEEVRKILAEKSVAGFREQAKSLVKKYGGGSLTDINPVDYPALVREAEALE